MAHLGVATALGVWLPLRMVFFDGMAAWDFVADLIVGGLTTASYFGSGEIEMSLAPTTADLILALPLATFFQLVSMPHAKYSLLLKFIQLRRLKEIRKIVDSIDSLHPIAFRLLPLALIMPLVVHVVSCGWIWLGSGTAARTDDQLLEYGRAVYWAITTLCTVGYGDIAAKTLPQMFYASFTMILGVGFFGYLLSNVASLLSRLDAAREEHLAVLDKVEGFMRSNGLPPPLKLNVRAYYRYLWETRRGSNDLSVLAGLPHKLRREISLFLCAEMIEKVPILKGADAEMVEDLVLALEPQVVVPGETIFKAGDPGDTMFFIHQGTIQISSAQGQLLATLQLGSFFGEVALLHSQPRTATATAVGYADLYALRHDAFEQVLAKHPKFAEHLHETVSKRGHGKKAA